MAAPRSEIPIIVLSESSPTSPIAGASAFVKDRATSTLVSVFSDSGTTNNIITQPLTTDSGGRLTGWLPRGAYILEITVPGKVPYVENLDISPGSNEAVETSWLANNTVTASKIGPEAIETSKVKNSGITQEKIANESINASKLSANAVIESKISNQAINTGKLAELCVTSSKLGASSVTEEKITDAVVTSRKVKLTSGVIRSTGEVNIGGGGWKEVTGAKLEVTPAVKSKLLVIATFNFQLSGNGSGANGSFKIDGGSVDEINAVAWGFGSSSAQIALEGLSGNWEFEITGGTKHTLQMMAKGNLGEGLGESRCLKGSNFLWFMHAI